MASNQKKTKIAIIGGGLAGLTAAALLERAGAEYLLVEAQDAWGGLIKGQKEKDFWLDHGIKSIPAGPDISRNPVVELKKDLDLPFGLESWTDVPKTFQSGGNLVDFVGFGDVKNRTLVETLGYYTQTPRLMVSGGWNHMVEALLNLIPEKKRLAKSIVTKLEVNEDLVTEAVINGETVLKAEHFVFTLPPSALRELLPQGAVNNKILQRIARTTPLTAISLDITTENKITDAKNLFVLSENPKEKGEDPLFVIGQFISNVDPLRQPARSQNSTWMTFVEPEAIEDDESGSKILKTMKKLIKKAFPPLVDAAEGTKNWERILVVPQALAHFDQLTLEENRTLPGLTNLWICGAQAPATSRYIGAAAESARAVAANLIEELNQDTARQENKTSAEISPEA